VNDADPRSPSDQALIRPATSQDVPSILALVRALAEYEREPQAAVGTEADFRAALFPTDAGGSPPGASPTAFAHIATVGDEVAGFALWFITFSTWTGKPGIWLEDLFVCPEHRGLGLGQRLLATLAAECVQRGYARLDWAVLDWNTPSIEFYRRHGAVALDEWTQYRLDGQSLAEMARVGEPFGESSTTSAR